MSKFVATGQSPILIPSDVEREMMLYWLRRVSSVTAWRRICSYYQSWADVVEECVRIADDNGWGNETSLPLAEYALILKCLAHCEEGVVRLAKGDKRVFKFDARGEFAMAARMLSHWVQMLERIRTGENVLKKKTPLWPEFCDALNSLAQAWGECGPVILEPRYLEDPALVTYGDGLQNQLKRMDFPDVLAPVPDPVDSVFVRTGQYTPCSGIWEPVDLPKPSLISLVTRTPKPKPPFKVVGAMNYLHGGSRAPRVSVETADDILDIDATWRLLWKDERYSDGTVPEEEQSYRFSKPDDVLPPPPASGTTEALVWAKSGTAAPVSGKWLAEIDLGVAVHLKEGDKLPIHNGRNIRWVLAAN